MVIPGLGIKFIEHLKYKLTDLNTISHDESILEPVTLDEYNSIPIDSAVSNTKLSKKSKLRC